MKKILISVALAIVLLGIGYIAFSQYGKTPSSTEESLPINQATSTAEGQPENKAPVSVSSAEITGAPYEVPPATFAKLTLRGDVPRGGFGDQAKQYYWRSGASVYVVRDLEVEGPDLGNMTITGGDAYRIPSADASTFVTLADSFEDPQFARDRNYVYYRGTILLSADPATFTQDWSTYNNGSYLVRDKNRSFIVNADGSITLEDGTLWIK